MKKAFLHNPPHEVKGEVTSFFFRNCVVVIREACGMGQTALLSPLFKDHTVQLSWKNGQPTAPAHTMTFIPIARTAQQSAVNAL